MPNKRFIPTDQQRLFVSVMSAARMSLDSIARTIVHERTGRPISRHTLERAFKEELATGNAKVRGLVLKKWHEKIEQGDWNAIQWGLKNLCGFTDQAALAVNIGDTSALPGGLKLEFVKSPLSGTIDDGPTPVITDELKHIGPPATNITELAPLIVERRERAPEPSFTKPEPKPEPPRTEVDGLRGDFNAGTPVSQPSGHRFGYLK
jgi:hypothetical protein